MLLTYIIYVFLMYLFYPIIFIAFSIMMIFNKPIRKGALSRLGFIYPKENNKNAVWIHAVSVGEITAVKEIVFTLIERGYSVYLSTTTVGGYDIARKNYGDKVQLFYLTLDYPNMLNKLINLISPEYVMIAEIEIWPAFIYLLHKKLIPLYMINGRIGKKEIKGYKNFKFFFKPYFNMYTKILAQSSIDKENMISIGMPESLITVTGNLKYDINYFVDEKKIDDIENTIPVNKFVITAGSTHQGEEELILKALNNLKIKVYIVIVPRDITRGEDIQKLANKLGYDLPLYTDYDKKSEDGIIINTIGELLNWYKLSDLVIMGGTFMGNMGGHNILEAIYFEKLVIVGKYMYNFIEIYEYMKEAVLTCDDKKNLSDIIQKAYQDEELRNTLSKKAYNLLIQNNGASKRTIDIINKYQGII
ncbi:glycosyltransferase N-terminal domain-containing protein [uncultured Brachyspira sp.]|uniref:3-deoxy-D-manno-octulosonic acid transferase n=2 Tax=uncultured Brachyspira sp. TaxID=221953 RepID=UPI0025CE7101|nr:glycosyltransferase N-terminal domain-containing protein [uncultured Brachyspira sp.]